ncbi:MAG: DUF4097 family beta strand repeat-containing protein [Candidatus Latescibacterota bacterium]
MRHFIAIALALVVMSALAGEAVCKELVKDFHESFDVEKGYRLKLQHGDGDVTITPWDQDVLDVTIHYKASYKSIGLGGEREFDAVFTKKGSVIEVTGKETGHGGVGIHYSNTIEYTYTIKAPSYLELQIDGDDGDVKISGWDGDVECDLDDGDIQLDDITAEQTRVRLEDGNARLEGCSGKLIMEGSDGDITIMDSNLSLCRIRVEDGDVKVDRSAGEFEVQMDDGDVRFYQLTSNGLDIESEDGDVDIDLVEAGVINIDIRTDDGEVTIYLPHNASAAFTIDVDDGSINVELPELEVLGKKHGWLSGRIRDGRGQIKIRTADGDVVLKETK